MKYLHTFAICAYKESAYLEECIKSIQEQTIKSSVILVTSTPNEYIEKISEKYCIPVFVNEGERGITQDWNYAYKMAKTEYVTLAHQDDVYFPLYAETMLMKMQTAKKPIIGFSDYAEIRNGKTIYDNKLLKIKRLMLMPLRIKVFQKSIWIRRRILSLGCPICCPSVTFAKNNIEGVPFCSGFRSDEDWEAWEKLSKEKGEFVYIQKAMMGHRIHEESETSIIIGDNARIKEDLIMFKKFWPSFIAKILAKFYASSEKSNELESK